MSTISSAAAAGGISFGWFDSAITVGGGVLSKTIYIDSSCSQNIDVDGYCKAEAVTIAAENFVVEAVSEGGT